jgi:hypothetical protein
MSGYSKLRRIVGAILAAWGGIRTVVDLLGSLASTKEYISASYVQIISAPSSRTLTVTVIIVGLVLLLFESVTNLWAKREVRPSPDVNDKHEEVEPCAVEMIPSEGPSTEMLLSVKNNDAPQRFRAQARILARRNDPNQLRRVTYDLEWERTGTTDVKLAKGESCNLRIATAYDDHNSNLDYLELWGLSGNVRERKEWSRWSIGQVTKPEYDIEIIVFGEIGASAKIFTLRTGNNVALEMHEKETASVHSESKAASTISAGTGGCADKLLSYVGIDGEGWFVLQCGKSYLQLVNIYNSESANPVTANNVRATIRYTHANGRDVFEIHDAVWRAHNPRTQANEFPSTAFIEPNTRGRLLLLGQLESDLKKWFVPDLHSGNMRGLNPGYWNVIVTLESDNCATFIGRGGFTILSGDGRLVYDTPALTFSYELRTLSDTEPWRASEDRSDTRTAQQGLSPHAKT